MPTSRFWAPRPLAKRTPKNQRNPRFNDRYRSLSRPSSRRGRSHCHRRVAKPLRSARARPTASSYTRRRPCRPRRTPLHQPHLSINNTDQFPPLLLDYKSRGRPPTVPFYPKIPPCVPATNRHSSSTDDCTDGADPDPPPSSYPTQPPSEPLIATRSDLFLLAQPEPR